MKSIQKIASAILVAALALTTAWPAGAAVNPGAKFSGGNLTLEAKNATIGELLEVISRTAGVDVFVSRGFEAAQEKRTIKIEGEPLEEALRRILRGFNYAAIYVKEGDSFRVAAVKIYLEGVREATVPLYTGRAPAAPQHEKGSRGEVRTVIVTSTGEMTTYGALKPRGVLSPSRTIPGSEGAQAALQEPWFALQVQLEHDEAIRYEGLIALEQKMEGAVDAESRKALSLAFADEAAKFHVLKRGNMNKIESLKRIHQFRAISSE